MSAFSTYHQIYANVHSVTYLTACGQAIVKFRHVVLLERERFRSRPPLIDLLGPFGAGASACQGPIACAS